MTKFSWLTGCKCSKQVIYETLMNMWSRFKILRLPWIWLMKILAVIPEALSVSALSFLYKLPVSVDLPPPVLQGSEVRQVFRAAAKLRKDEAAEAGSLHFTTFISSSENDATGATERWGVQCVIIMLNNTNYSSLRKNALLRNALTELRRSCHFLLINRLYLRFFSLKLSGEIKHTNECIVGIKHFSKYLRSRRPPFNLVERHFRY